VSSLFVVTFITLFVPTCLDLGACLLDLCFFSNLWRTTSEEKRELERFEKPIYNSVRRAAEVHRQVCFLIRVFLWLFSAAA
jgi:hypothetical protein